MQMPDSKDKPHNTTPREKLITRKGARTAFEVSLMSNLYDSLFEELDSVVSKLEDARENIPPTSLLEKQHEKVVKQNSLLIKIGIALALLSVMQLLLILSIVLT